jgi:Leucine-rich repeat (LRR) protein
MILMQLIEIADLKNLKLICFSNNELTTVAPEICLLPNLERLYLRGNMLKGIIYVILI